MDVIEKLAHWMNSLTWREWLAWLGGAIVAIIAVRQLGKKAIQSADAWMALPTLEQYWELHPNCKTDSGPKCYKCNSKNFRNIKGDGLAGDENRTIVCRHCGTVLYRISGEPTNPVLRAVLAKHAPGKPVDEAWRSARSQMAKK